MLFVLRFGIVFVLDFVLCELHNNYFVLMFAHVLVYVHGANKFLLHGVVVVISVNKLAFCVFYV